MHDLANEFLEKRACIDDRLEAYRSFYDHDWSRNLHEQSKSACKLREMVLDLCITIKGIGRTAEIPSIAVTLTESYVTSFKLHQLSDSDSMRLINHLAARIEQEVVLKPADLMAVKTAMLKIADKARQDVAGMSMPFPKQELWDSMIKVLHNDPDHAAKNEFRVGIVACQRICFSGLYFAYEDFLVRCIATKLGRDIRATDRDFAASCDQALGKSLASQCRGDSKISAAKKVRDALAHAGGRETQKLRDHKNHGYLVADGIIQILPEDVSGLFQEIKPRITKLVEWAAPLSEFA